MSDYGSNSQQYKIVAAGITADRFASGKVIDISNMITEINLFEDIDKPYISGSVVIVDDRAVLDNIDFRGTETLSIELQGVDNTKEVLLQRKFYITAVQTSVRTNDRTEVTVLTLMDQAGYNTHAKRISKSYTGKVEDIITAIIVSELGVEVDRSYASPSIQPPTKVIVPYLHPLQAVVWLREFATRSNGSPYFVYASIFDDNIRIGDYDTMMGQDAFNKALPYHYSASTINSAERAGLTRTGNKELDRSFTVTSVTKRNMENTLDMIKDGSVGSTYTSTDIGGGVTSRTDHTIESTLNQLKVSDVIKSYQLQNVYDEQAKIDLGPKGSGLASEYSSRQFHKITSSNTYAGNGRSLSEDVGDGEVNIKAKAACIHTMLNRNSISIEIPGAGFMIRKISVGDVVNVNFLEGNTSLNPESGQNVIEANRSGDYLILAARHVFQGTTHNISLNISKIAKGSRSDG